MRCFKLIGYLDKRNFSKNKQKKFVNSAETVDSVESDDVKTGIDSCVLTPDVIDTCDLRWV